MPQLSGFQRAWLAWLCCAVTALAACKRQCPPLSIQEGEFCRWTRDAGSGGGNSAGTGGGATPWKCGQAADGCECKASDDGTGYDGCVMPKPGCCYLFSEADTQRCTCVPKDSEDCDMLKMQPDARSARSCPP